MLKRIRFTAWWILWTGFSYGICERTFTYFSDKVFIGEELGALLVVCVCMLLLTMLYPYD